MKTKILIALMVIAVLVATSIPAYAQQSLKDIISQRMYQVYEAARNASLTGLMSQIRMYYTQFDKKRSKYDISTAKTVLSTLRGADYSILRADNEKAEVAKNTAFVSGLIGPAVAKLKELGLTPPPVIQLSPPYYIPTPITRQRLDVFLNELNKAIIKEDYARIDALLADREMGINIADPKTVPVNVSALVKNAQAELTNAKAWYVSRKNYLSQVTSIYDLALIARKKINVVLNPSRECGLKASNYGWNTPIGMWFEFTLNPIEGVTYHGSIIKVDVNPYSKVATFNETGLEEAVIKAREATAAGLNIEIDNAHVDSCSGYEVNSMGMPGQPGYHEKGYWFVVNTPQIVIQYSYNTLEGSAALGLRVRNIINKENGLEMISKAVDYLVAEGAYMPGYKILEWRREAKDTISIKFGLTDGSTPTAYVNVHTGDVSAIGVVDFYIQRAKAALEMLKPNAVLVNAAEAEHKEVSGKMDAVHSQIDVIEAKCREIGLRLPPQIQLMPPYIPQTPVTPEKLNIFIATLEEAIKANDIATIKSLLADADIGIDINNPSDVPINISNLVTKAQTELECARRALAGCESYLTAITKLYDAAELARKKAAEVLNPDLLKLIASGDKDGAYWFSFQLSDGSSVTLTVDANGQAASLPEGVESAILAAREYTALKMCGDVSVVRINGISYTSGRYNMPVLELKVDVGSYSLTMHDGNSGRLILTAFINKDTGQDLYANAVRYLIDDLNAGSTKIVDWGLIANDTAKFDFYIENGTRVTVNVNTATGEPHVAIVKFGEKAREFLAAELNADVDAITLLEEQFVTPAGLMGTSRKLATLQYNGVTFYVKGSQAIIPGAQWGDFSLTGPEGKISNVPGDLIPILDGGDVVPIPEGPIAIPIDMNPIPLPQGTPEDGITIKPPVVTNPEAAEIGAQMTVEDTVEAAANDPLTRGATLAVNTTITSTEDLLNK